MCGIAGIVDLSGAPARADDLRRMCDLLAHRGPDGSGEWVSGSVALGQRRLSIVDLSERARNPMPNEDQTVWATVNGEIYNHQELRSDLGQRGHVFRSDCDTEVILHLFEELGSECVSRLNGMFAFGLWDVSRRRLLLARDRFGVKPLYYTVVGNTLAFASEVKAFLALPGFRVKPDVRAMAEHFTFQNTFGERTLFEDVKLLPAGHYLMCEDGQIRTRQYWDLRFEPDASLSLQESAHRLREHFERAVDRQLMSDVPLGTYLSGGMDTGAISAVAATQIPRMHTFTCGFAVPEGASSLEQYFDERDASRDLARLLGTVHHELELGSDAMTPALPAVVWHLDEPRVGISYQNYYTAELVRRHVTVVLSGCGGDELFAGYPWRYEAVLGFQPAAFEEAYYGLTTRFLTDDQKRGLFTPEIRRALGDFSTRDAFRDVLENCDADDPLNRALYFDFKTFLNGLLLVDDKLSMAHSVEARVPFLDNDLVDFVATIPSEFKLAQGRSKIVLREALRGLLPQETLNRRKQGFTPPDETWYKGKSLAYIEDLVLGSRARDRGYFEPGAVRGILDDHLRGRRNNRFLIWSFMCFEWWNRLFVDREPIPEEAIRIADAPTA